MNMKLITKQTTEIEFDTWEKVFEYADSLPPENEVTIWHDDCILVYDRSPVYLEKNTYWDDWTLKTSYVHEKFDNGYNETTNEFYKNGEVKYVKEIEVLDGETIYSEETFYDKNGMIVESTDIKD